MENQIKQMISEVEKELNDPRIAIQDGLLIAFNDAKNNEWIEDKRIASEPFDCRDFITRFIWKRK